MSTDLKVAKPKHCRGCLFLHLGGTHGPWCCKGGRKAKRAIGECKLKNWKDDQGGW